MSFPLLVFPLQNPYAISQFPYSLPSPHASMRVLPHTYTFLPHCPSIPLHWGIKPHRTKGLPSH